MANLKPAIPSLKLSTVSKKDFPKEFEDYKSLAEYYLEVRIEHIDKKPRLTDFYIVSELLIDIPYYLEYPGDRLVKLFDARVQSIFKGLEFGEDIVSQLFKKRFYDLAVQPITEIKLINNNISATEIFGGILIFHKDTWVAPTSLPIHPDTKSEASRGSVGLLFSLILNAGFFKKENLAYFYGTLTALTGHSFTGWKKAVSKDIKKLVSRGKDISELDLHTVIEFLEESLESLQKIRSELPKHRQKNK